jgi:hypothetical protein
MSQPLYGGALCISLPATYRDVSEVRQVPDHQEVWADLASSASLVLEIVEHQAAVADSGAARYFWEDLLETNGVQTERGWRVVPTVPAMLPAPFREPKDGRCGALAVCAGWQVLAVKGEEPAPSEPGSESSSSSSSSSAAATASSLLGAGGGAAPASAAKDTVFVCMAVLRLPGVGSEIILTLNWPLGDGPGASAKPSEEQEAAALALLSASLSSLDIRDWGLFQ